MKNLMCVLAIAILLASCSKDDDKPSIKEIVISGEKITADEITAVWLEVEDAIYYEVAITPGTEDDIYTVLGKTSITYSNLLANKDYEISVKAGTSFTDEKIIAEGKQTLKTLSLPEEFFGTWKYQYQTNSLIYTFNEDGTGTYEYRYEMPIRWKADESTITITKFYDDGTSQTETWAYEFSDVDVLVMDGTLYFLED